MLVTTPFVLLLLDCWPLRRLSLTDHESRIMDHGSRITHHGSRILLFEKLPFFALAAACSVLTYNVQQQAVWSISYLPLAARVENAVVAYCRYLGKLFWPVNLSVFYPHPGSWPAVSVVLAALLLFGISVLAIGLRRRAPFLAVGWFWFAGTLVPVIGLVQVGWQSIADRYTYIPFIGLFIGLVWGAEALSRDKNGRLEKWNIGMMEGGPRRAALAVAGLALITLALFTRQQIGYWKNSETLFTHALAVTKDNFLAHYNLGIALLGQARLDEAITEFKEAISLRPKSGDAYNGLGEALMRQGRLDEAVELFHKAVNLRPDLAVARNNLGISLSRRGLVDQAINEFQEALKTKPDYAKAYNNLGMALQAQGRLEDAIIQLQHAVSLAPQDSEAHNNLGIALARKGLLEEAIYQLQQATRINPSDAQAHHNLGFALSKQGRLDEAIIQLQRSLELRPDSADTHAILGAALAKKGLRSQAITHFEQALKLRPNYPEAEQQLHALKGGKP